MTEQEELAKLEAKKQKIEMKYAKIAKQYLHQINETFDPNVSFIEMSKTQFKAYVTEHFSTEKINSRDALRLQKLSNMILSHFKGTDQKSFLAMSDKDFETWLNETKMLLENGIDYRNEHRNN